MGRAFSERENKAGGIKTEGRIVKGIGGFYYVRLEDGSVYECKAKGLFRKEGLTPMIGDLAELTILPSEGDRRIEANFAGEARIERILPRKNSFVRPPVSNVDLFAVVFAARDPEPVPLLIDSLLVAAEQAETGQMPSCFCRIRIWSIIRF